MGRRSERTKRQLRNRYRNPFGGPYQQFDAETGEWFWAGGRWDKTAKEWREASYNWTPTAPLYFAYGSNLNYDQMALRACEAEPFAKMNLPNWKLVFRGVADIEPAPDEAVPGGLWRITGADEWALDRYEGVKSGFYGKHYFPVSYTDESGERIETQALVYIMKRSRGLWRPDDAYYDSIVQGYKDFGLNDAPLQAARAEAQKPFVWSGYSKDESGHRIYYGWD